MVQAISRRPASNEALVQSPTSPCGICTGQIDKGTGLPPNTPVLSCRYHSSIAPYFTFVSHRCYLSDLLVSTLSNYQLNAQFFYFPTICMLHYVPQHVSSSTPLILRRTNCITTASGIVTLCKQPFSMQVESGLTTFLNMFRAARLSSSGGQIVPPQLLVSSPSVSSRSLCRWRAD